MNLKLMVFKFKSQILNIKYVLKSRLIIVYFNYAFTEIYLCSKFAVSFPNYVAYRLIICLGNYCKSSYILH